MTDEIETHMEFEGPFWEQVQQARLGGKLVAFVPGVFDVLHAGHIELFSTARETGALVVAGVFDDASSRVLKGPGRPVVSERARQQILQSLKFVDVAILVNGRDMEPFLERLCPDIVIRGKGDDSVFIGGNTARMVEILPVSGHSVSSILDDVIEGVDLLPDRPYGLPPANGDGAPNPFTFSMRAPSHLRTKSDISRVFTIRGPVGDDLIFSSIRDSKSFFELTPLLNLSMLVRKKGIVVDVGANIGNHTIFFAAFMAEQVISLEPAPELYALLCENIGLNALGNVHPFRLAAGDQPGMGRIFHPPSSVRNAGAWQVRPVKNDKPGDVQIERLDTLLESHAENLRDLPVTLLKIDVEGSELAVLLGAEQTIQRHRPVIYIELAIDVTFNAVTKYLHKLGYRVAMRFGTVIPSYIFEPVVNPGN